MVSDILHNHSVMLAVAASILLVLTCAVSGYLYGTGRLGGTNAASIPSVLSGFLAMLTVPLNYELLSVLFAMFTLPMMLAGILADDR